MLRLIERVASAAAATGRPVAVCGEVAGDRLLCRCSSGSECASFDQVTPWTPAAKQAVRVTDTRAAGSLARSALAAESAAAVRRLLAAAAAAAADQPHTHEKGP